MATVPGALVSYPGNGSEVDGYLVHHDDGEPRSGIIVIQEFWGLDAHIKDMSDRLAREGYVVLAPDLYHGAVASEPDEARKIAMNLDRARALDEIHHAIDYLQSREDVQPREVGVIGFCMGGTLAWRIAEIESGEIAAVAAFYAGRYDPSAEDIRKITAPVLAVWGAEDGGIPAQQRDRIVELLKREGKTHRALVYQAGHAFMNDQHDTYDDRAAEEAWAELLAWFRQYLGDSEPAAA